MANSDSSVPPPHSSRIRAVEKSLHYKVEEKTFKSELDHMEEKFKRESEQSGERHKLELGRIDEENKRELAHLAERLDEVKKSAENCFKKGEIAGLQVSVSNMRKVKVATIIVLMGLIIGASAQYYDFKNKVDNTGEAVESNSEALAELKDAMVSIRLANVRMVDAFEARMKEEDRKELESLLMIRRVLAAVEKKTKARKKRLR